MLIIGEISIRTRRGIQGKTETWDCLERGRAYLENVGRRREGGILELQRGLSAWFVGKKKGHESRPNDQRPRHIHGNSCREIPV